MTRLRVLLCLIGGDRFARALLCAVSAASILAFVFGAAAELVIALPVLGVATALAEISMHPNE
ncbi:hypothetical protein OZ411_26445 [Bradyrhizobium sp. Arg237L]|uniref:hypothetical protein n=1 Tax=Bradyrhizobium sp. Arg237L TaxID=3003352 RepID=UPI00249DFDA3|nr:hypothetical protein [Bradyrhizobium sp. Arg237L]MDI4236359.1 hypothetical protein [Bradyrhizobium sp. Arg237L]